MFAALSLNGHFNPMGDFVFFISPLRVADFTASAAV